MSSILSISRIHEGLPTPLGATWDGIGVNFAVFSANATKVELCLFDAGGERDDLSFDERDSSRFVPKCRVIDPAFTWSRDRAPRIPWDRTIFYEMHVKGFTKLHPAVKADLRGT